MDGGIQSKSLLENVHVAMQPPKSSGKTILVRGNYKYFHYGCDSINNDHGWGCGYRTLQTICSWICLKNAANQYNVPGILEIQKILADIECRPEKLVGSRDWIGAMEVFYVLDKLYGVPCRILHKTPGNKFSKEDVEKLINYFLNFGGICMMGGNNDAASKGICGIHVPDDFQGTSYNESEIFLLVIDPHYGRQPQTSQELIDGGYVRWQPLNDFDRSSFYNICMPELK